jgi:hypothetical protein
LLAALAAWLPDALPEVSFPVPVPAVPEPEEPPGEDGVVTVGAGIVVEGWP